MLQEKAETISESGRDTSYLMRKGRVATGHTPLSRTGKRRKSQTSIHDRPGPSPTASKKMKSFF